MSDKKERNKNSARKYRNHQKLDLLTYCRLLCGNFRYIISLKPAQIKSKVTYETFLIDMIYRPCDGEYELIYDSREHTGATKKGDTIRRYFTEYIVLKELQSCGFSFKWKNYAKEYTFDGITFGRQVPWY